jgi:hypothetical protein
MIDASRRILVENNLTMNEKDEFSSLEGIIGREMGSFMAVGNSLLTIRDRRLYREGYKNFKEYCDQKWQMGRQYASRLITGSQIVANLSPRGDLCTPCEIMPINEAQVRPLTILEPAQQREVWEEAVKTYVVDHPGKAPTYSHVKAAVKEYLGPPPATPPAPPKKKDPYTYAHNYVSMAMANLMRIRDDDPLKIEAMQRLIDWAQEQITLWTKEK